jgi:hypothetical protein
MTASSNQGIAIGASKGLAAARAWQSTRVRIGVTAVVLASVVGVTVRTWVTLRADFRSTEAQMAVTRARLDDLGTDLRVEGLAREQAIAGYDLALQELERRQVARDLSYTQLVEVDRRLELRSHDLWRVAHDLQARQERLSHLSLCAAGAARALNQASIDDTDGLARTLRAIEPSCTAARAT